MCPFFIMFITLKLQVCNLNRKSRYFYAFGTNNLTIWLNLISVDLDNYVYPSIYKIACILGSVFLASLCAVIYYFQTLP